MEDNWLRLRWAGRHTLYLDISAKLTWAVYKLSYRAARFAVFYLAVKVIKPISSVTSSFAEVYSYTM